MTISSIRTSISHSRAQNIVEQNARGYYTEVQKRIYYPYYWFFFANTVKTLLGVRTIRASCLVDLCSGQASTTDNFMQEEIEADMDSVLEGKIGEEEAYQKARTYVVHSTIHVMKALLCPEIVVLEKRILHKLFWIVKCSHPGKEPFRVIVDSVTGTYEILA